MRLDLNGKSINAVANGSCSNGGVTHFIRVKSGGDLTITDTSDDKSGCITATYGANSVLEVSEIMSDGKLTLADGKIQNVASTNYGSSSVYVRDGGTFILNGGTATAVKPNASKRAYAVYNAGAMKMLSGSIVSSDSSTAAVTQSSSSPLEISGGNIDSANKMFISASQGKAVAIISGGQFSGALKVKWIAECAVGINNETGSTADKAAPETYNACINSKLYFTGETDADEAVKALASYVINPGASSVKTIKSLKKGKYYYMKGRSYKKVGSTTYYGAWSKTKLRKKSNRATKSCSGSADKDE